MVRKSQLLNDKRRFLWLSLVLFGLLLLWMVLTQPFLVHRLFSKIFTAYELQLFRYPSIDLFDKKITATSKVTMATHYYYHTSDEIEIVLDYIEEQIPGFFLMHGSRVINEPTFVNFTCANDTAFRNIFAFLDKGTPCIEVYIYPSETTGTIIRISEHWTSMDFPSWIIRW
jgi:hypothetical protein